MSDPKIKRTDTLHHHQRYEETRSTFNKIKIRHLPFEMKPRSETPSPRVATKRQQAQKTYSQPSKSRFIAHESRSAPIPVLFRDSLLQGLRDS